MDLPGPTGRGGSVEQRPVLSSPGLLPHRPSAIPATGPFLLDGALGGWVSSPGAARWGRSKSSASRLKNKAHPIPEALPLCSEVRPPVGF